MILKVNRKPGYVEAKYGNNAFGHKAYASKTDTSWVGGIETNGLGGKWKTSIGYQGGANVDNEKIDAAWGVGANFGSEVIPGTTHVVCK